MESVILAFLGIFVVALALEWLAHTKSPELLARLAFLPIARSRTARIPDAALNAGQAAAGYRETAREPLRLRALLSVTRLEGVYVVGAWEPGYGWLRIPWHARTRALGVVRIDYCRRGNGVRLAAKALPCPIAGLVLLPASLFGRSFQEGLAMLVFFLFGTAIAWASSLKPLHEEAEQVLKCVVRDLESAEGLPDSAVRTTPFPK